MEKKEEKLISRAQNGDREAFEILLKKYEARTYSSAYRILGNRSDAADVLQEASISAFQALPKFSGRSTFGTWFYRIAINLCLLKLRKQKEAPISLESMTTIRKDDGAEQPFEITDWSHNPAASLANTELRELLEKKIAGLPDIYRTPFVLYEIEDLPVKDVARILKISESAVKTRLHRSRSLLREKLSHYFQHLKSHGAAT
ncbi:MAG: sigma-70 family RNA polymerase sigma factor [Candidatus Omnitrophica bacterium]|nr:sigma-70 family RNA polymerase sigma factor [Candidatus Omnitrophota bacterium]